METGIEATGNLLLCWPLLTERERQECEASGVYPLSDRQRAIETLRSVAALFFGFEATKEYRAAYTILISKLQGKLQGPPYSPPADQSD